MKHGLNNLANAEGQIPAFSFTKVPIAFVSAMRTKLFTSDYLSATEDGPVHDISSRGVLPSSAKEAGNSKPCLRRNFKFGFTFLHRLCSFLANGKNASEKAGFRADLLGDLACLPSQIRLLCSLFSGWQFGGGPLVADVLRKRTECFAPKHHGSMTLAR